MSIGSGIAIAAVWGAVVAAMFAPDVGGAGLFMMIMVALLATGTIACVTGE